MAAGCPGQTGHGLAEGFEALTIEYQRIWLKSRALERKVAAAREELDRLASQRVTGCTDFDKLTEFGIRDEDAVPSLQSTNDWWARNLDMDEASLSKIRKATEILQACPRKDIQSSQDRDKSVNQSISNMPSISESPLEQDFTTSGTPSKLGCPFASMANRKLGSHAASVVSKYRPNGTITPRSSVSRINGRASSVAQASIMDQPSKAELCGALELTSSGPEDVESVQGSAAAGRCPIRYLKKTSPEEVAAYFEEHKHEIPRSHEVCVRRYQSNEESIRELDAKYGNLVSMIQGLGQKHVPMLPETPMEIVGDSHDRSSEERVRKWATAIDDAEGQIHAEGGEQEEERMPHFDRPLKDVRIGESPSRPWGIQVPFSALERRKSTSSSIVTAAGATKRPEPMADSVPIPDVRAADVQGKCPLGHGVKKATPKESRPPMRGGHGKHNEPVVLDLHGGGDGGGTSKAINYPQMTFTGPVFIGYSADQATALLEAMNRKPE